MPFLKKCSEAEKPFHCWVIRPTHGNQTHLDTQGCIDLHKELTELLVSEEFAEAVKDFAKTFPD